MKVYEGTILTCDAQDHVYRYLVEDAGRILYTGNTLPAAYADAERVALDEKALCPAFGDSHIHFASYATFRAGLNVSDAESNAEILEMLREFIPRCTEKLIIVFGASNHSVAEKRLLTRTELDSVCPDKPLFLVKYDGHTCVVNTVLRDRLKRKAGHLRGWHEDTGEMNQEAFFAFSDYVSGSVSPLRLFRNMQSALDHLAEKGIGMIHTVSGVGYPLDLDVDLERWFARGLSNGMQMRVYFQTMDVKKATRSHLPRIGGCFEAALDGSFGALDAAMMEPYEGTDQKGILYNSDEKVIEFCKQANRAGLQIEMHAIGDAAFDQAARALKAALDDFPRSNHRHTIIHACLPTEEGLRICADYGVSFAMQSALLDWRNEPTEYLEAILGERAQKMNPFKTYSGQGIPLSFSSDGPCTDPDPLMWIHKACNCGEESLTVQQALKACTCNVAWTSFNEAERGSLEPGKIADLVLLSADPYQTPVEQLNTLIVEQLYLNGKPYQSAIQNPVSHLLRGLTRRSVKI